MLLFEPGEGPHLAGRSRGPIPEIWTVDQVTNGHTFDSLEPHANIARLVLSLQMFALN